MHDIDVLIIGGGPAGTSAAYDFATAGLKVLIIDKSDFPRDKTCGGGLTPKTLSRMRFDISPVLERHCNSLEVTNNCENRKLLPEDGLLCAMTQRRHFDDLLMQQARKAGAGFEVVADLSSISQTPQGITAHFKSGRTITAKWLVAADGAKSHVRRLTHGKQVVRQAFGLEGKAPLPAGKPLISFDFFVVPWGYGWVFPKGDHANVGICTFNRNVKLSKEDLLTYARRKVGHANLTEILGFPLGIGIGNGAKSKGRILFVGDAAGTVEPLLGEGIHNAIMSGQKAANALIKGGNPSRVRWRYWRGMLSHTSEGLSCFNIHKLFYSMPRVGYWWLTRPFFIRGLARGFTQGHTMDKIVQRLLLTGH